MPAALASSRRDFWQSSTARRDCSNDVGMITRLTS